MPDRKSWGENFFGKLGHSKVPMFTGNGENHFQGRSRTHAQGRPEKVFCLWPIAKLSVRSEDRGRAENSLAKCWRPQHRASLQGLRQAGLPPPAFVHSLSASVPLSPPLSPSPPLSLSVPLSPPLYPSLPFPSRARKSFSETCDREYTLDKMSVEKLPNIYGHSIYQETKCGPFTEDIRNNYF